MKTLNTKDFDIGDLFYVVSDSHSPFIGKIGIVYDSIDEMDNYIIVDDHFRAFFIGESRLEYFSTELHNTKLIEVPKAIEILYHEDIEKLKIRRD